MLSGASVLSAALAHNNNIPDSIRAKHSSYLSQAVFKSLQVAYQPVYMGGISSRQEYTDGNQTPFGMPLKVSSINLANGALWRETLAIRRLKKRSLLTRRVGPIGGRAAMKPPQRRSHGFSSWYLFRQELNSETPALYLIECRHTFFHIKFIAEGKGGGGWGGGTPRQNSQRVLLYPDVNVQMNPPLTPVQMSVWTLIACFALANSGA